MTRSEKINISLVLLVFSALGVFVLNAVYHAFKEMHTRDRMGQIQVTLGRTLYRDTYDRGYSIANEFRKQFPEIKVDGDTILDAWHHPIKVDIRDLKDRFEVDIHSPGRDGRADTEDDILNHLIFSDIDRKPENRNL